jgi:hypothetical protein
LTWNALQDWLRKEHKGVKRRSRAHSGFELLAGCRAFTSQWLRRRRRGKVDGAAGTDMAASRLSELNELNHLFPMDILRMKGSCGGAALACGSSCL